MRCNLPREGNGPAVAGVGGALRILITEDDVALAEALRFALKQAGYAVDCVSDGAAADEALKATVFDLLILDLGLPKVDGFDVLRRLRERNLCTPVLILSGREKPNEKVYGLDLGADDYLVKPFSGDELLKIIAARLKKRDLIMKTFENNFEGLNDFMNSAKRKLSNQLLSNQRLIKSKRL